MRGGIFSVERRPGRHPHAERPRLTLSIMRETVCARASASQAILNCHHQPRTRKPCARADRPRASSYSILRSRCAQIQTRAALLGVRARAALRRSTAARSPLRGSADLLRVSR